MSTRQGTSRQTLRRRSLPATLAVPVAPASTLDELAGDVDDVICLATPEPFHAVGEHYRDFAQTSDDDVIGLLQAARAPSNEAK